MMVWNRPSHALDKGEEGSRMTAVFEIGEDRNGLETVLSNMRLDQYCGVVLNNGRHVCANAVAPVARQDLWRFGICPARHEHPVVIVVRNDLDSHKWEGLTSSFRVIPWGEIGKVIQSGSEGFEDLLEHFGGR